MARGKTFVILVLLLSTTIGFAYANKTVEEAHEDISAISYAGPFEDIGKNVGELLIVQLQALLKQ